MVAITPSDVAVVCSIASMIQAGRSSSSCDKKDVHGLLCFFADVIDMGSCRRFQSADEYFTVISKYISDQSVFLLDLRSKLNIEAVDDMIQIMDSMGHFFANPNLSDPNGACAPSIIQGDSFIGLYARTQLVKWRQLSFGDIAYLFEVYARFLKGCIDDLYYELSPTETKKACDSLPFMLGQNEDACYVDILNCHSGKRVEPRGHLLNAERAVLQNDLHPAKESLHSYFDSSGVDPLAPKGGGMEALSQGLPAQRARYQQAMLSLADMWVRGEYYTQATIATEEGMKMAHQLGDHASVARALLLLHHVVEGQQPDEHEEGDGTVSSENVLIRCIQRCAELNMRALEVQATLLLFRKRARGPIRPPVSAFLGYTFPSKGQQGNAEELYSGVDRLPPHCLWTLLSSALLDMSQLRNKPNSNISRQNQQQSTPSTSESNDTDWVLSHANTVAHVGLLAAEFWERLGMLPMAELACRRALRQCGVMVSTELLVHICTRLIDIHTQMMTGGERLSAVHYLLPELRMQSTDIDVEREERLNRLLSLSEQLVPHPNASSVSTPILYTRLSLRIRNSIVPQRRNESCMREALRDCDSLLQLVKESKQLSNALFQAQILQCLVMAYIEPSVAISICRKIFKEASAADYTLWAGEALVIETLLRTVTGGSHAAPICNAQFLLELSRRDFLPLVNSSLVLLLAHLKKFRTVQ